MAEGSAADAFEIVGGDHDSPVIVHVPHSSRAIPQWVRGKIVLNDDELERELELMTDARTEDIAREAATECSSKPWLFVNALSRLVVDPERFPDASVEPMAAPEIGMGPVYTRTAHGGILRVPSVQHERELLEAYFVPYANALSELVAERLEICGRAFIVDLHSFPRQELPYERRHHADAQRPVLCIGVDDFHTPPWLVDLVRTTFSDLENVAVNSPFAGTYVPLRFYSVDDRVLSVMVELRRDTYINDQRAQSGIAQALSALAHALSLE